jgi:hypothetical protein
MAETKYAIAAGKIFRENSIAAAVVPGVSTLIGTIHTHGAKRLFVELPLTVAPLTGFAIKARATPSADYVTLYNAAGEFTNPSGLLVGASGDLTTLAAAATGWFIMDVEGLESVQIFATSGGTASLAAYMGAI